MTSSVDVGRPPAGRLLLNAAREPFMGRGFPRNQGLASHRRATAQEVPVPSLRVNLLRLTCHAL